MDISICSDFHLGKDWDGERREDSFENARESIKKSLDSDLILLPGDLFDTRVPRQEVLSKAANIFSLPVLNSKSDLEIVDTDKENIPELAMRGTPAIAIHGTHERRSKSFVNPIQLLERMGYVIHLHGEYVVLQNEEGDKVAVHGLSGVPERYAKDALHKMSPEPIEGAYNILLLHQSIGGYVYSDDRDAIISVEDLPEGFDLIIDGHIHWYNIDDREKNKNLVFPGSTITTQMRKIEAEKPKGFLKLNTKTSKLEFIELESPREVFYEEVEVAGMDSQEARREINERIEKIVEKGLDKKPLVRIIIKGEDPLRISKNQIRKKFGEDVIITIKKKFESDSSRSKAFEEFEEERKSVEEVGMELLRDNVSKNNNFEGRLDFGPEDLFEVLAEGNKERAMKMLKDGVKEKKDSSKEKEENQDQNSKRDDENEKKQEESSEGSLNKFIKK